MVACNCLLMNTHLDLVYETSHFEILEGHLGVLALDVLNDVERQTTSSHLTLLKISPDGSDLLGEGQLKKLHSGQWKYFEEVSGWKAND